MAESIVHDWLSDYNSVHGQPNEVAAFVAEHEADQEIAEAIYTIFNDRLRHEELVHDICQQFLSFYRSQEDGLRKFPLQFIPVLIYTYLNSVAMGDKKSSRSVETLLICIYNAEVSTEDGSQRVVSFRMPILAQASVYHEEKNLPMHDLRRWEENCNREVKWGPYQQIEAINAQSRLRIMTALLFCYNQQVCLTQKAALIHLCRVASQMVNQGFSKQGHAHRISYGSDPSSGALVPKTLPRIPLSSQFLLELVHAIYFAMFNGFGTVAIQTLEDIHQRACFEMYTELILVTSAVRNSLHANPSGQPSDGPMGLSVALTPATTTVTTAVSKSMITNASFRTKKLPDDIPIQVQDLTMPQAPQPLASVTEEVDQTSSPQQPQQGTRNSIIRPSMEGIKAQAHKALIAGFKKSKDKEKDKEKEKEKDKDKERDGKQISSGVEPPKPPTRKFDKHSQRNSLLQLQAEGNITSLDYEIKSPASVGALKSKAYDSLEATEMLPMTTLLANESGSNSFSIDSELNGGNVINNNATSNPNTISNTTSIASSDLITKSFDSSIELPPISAGGGGGCKANDVGMD